MNCHADSKSTSYNFFFEYLFHCTTHVYSKCVSTHIKYRLFPHPLYIMNRLRNVDPKNKPIIFIQAPSMTTIRKELILYHHTYPEAYVHTDTHFDTHTYTKTNSLSPHTHTHTHTYANACEHDIYCHLSIDRKRTTSQVTPSFLSRKLGLFPTTTRSIGNFYSTFFPFFLKSYLSSSSLSFNFPLILNFKTSLNSFKCCSPPPPLPPRLLRLIFFFLIFIYSLPDTSNASAQVYREQRKNISDIIEGW